MPHLLPFSMREKGLGDEGKRAFYEFANTIQNSLELMIVPVIIALHIEPSTLIITAFTVVAAVSLLLSAAKWQSKWVIRTGNCFIMQPFNHHTARIHVQ